MRTCGRVLYYSLVAVLVLRTLVDALLGERNVVPCRPRSGPRSWETDSLTNYTLITMPFRLRDFRDEQYICKDEQYEKIPNGNQTTPDLRARSSTPKPSPCQYLFPDPLIIVWVRARGQLRSRVGSCCTHATNLTSARARLLACEVQSTRNLHAVQACLQKMSQGLLI